MSFIDPPTEKELTIIFDDKKASFKSGTGKIENGDIVKIIWSLANMVLKHFEKTFSIEEIEERRYLHELRSLLELIKHCAISIKNIEIEIKNENKMADKND